MVVRRASGPCRGCGAESLGEYCATCEGLGPVLEDRWASRRATQAAAPVQESESPAALFARAASRRRRMLDWACAVVVVLGIAYLGVSFAVPFLQWIGAW